MKEKSTLVRRLRSRLRRFWREVRKPGTIHLSVFALTIAVGAVTGTFGSLAVPIGFGVTNFWPGVAVQAVTSIWFGGWGVLAAGLFPLISNQLADISPYISFSYLPSNLLQGLIPLLAFKYLKLKPRLKSVKDYAGYVIFGVIVNNLVGATWAVFTLRALGLITVQSVPMFFFGWTVGNGVPSLIFGIITLKILSPLVVRSTAFCKGWWA